MQSISLPMHGIGHADYHLKLAQQDYYNSKGAEPGVWFGEGAAKLGLRGQVESRTYKNLLFGRSPDGRWLLVQNANHPHRQTGWDLTFSAPKCVSVLWSLSPTEVREQIELAHRRSVEFVLSHLEETAGLTRRGKGGTRLEHADLVFATFLHRTSRALDPQLHTHCLLINLAVRRDGTTGALWTEEIFRAKMASGALYRVQLAAELRQRLGLSIRPDRVGFQIEGVPKELCRLFSKRRQVIEAHLRELGMSDAVTAKKVTLDTRPNKIPTALHALSVAWQRTAEAHGWNATRLARLLHRSPSEVCSQKALEQRFREEVARTPEARRSPTHLRALAISLAVELWADARMFRPLLQSIQSATSEQSHVEPIAKPDHTHARDRHAMSAGREQPNATSASRHAGTASEQQQDAQAKEAGSSPGRQDTRGHRERSKSQKRSADQDRAKNSHTKRTRHRARAKRSRHRWQAADSHAGSSRVAGNEKLLRQLDPRNITTKEQQKALYFAWKDFMASDRGHELFSNSRFSVSRRQRKCNQNFLRAFERKAAQIPTQEQTRQSLTWQAVKLAREHHADSRTVYETLRDMQPGAERGWVHLEWRRIAPKAPRWSPVRNIKLPVIGFGAGRQRKWGKIVWKKSLLLAELRVQKRRVFRKAPKWSPVHGFELPVLRVVARQPESNQSVRPAVIQKKKQQSHEQSH